MNPKPRGVSSADEHSAYMRNLRERGALTPRPGDWCPVHLTQRIPCSACAGDHAAREHEHKPEPSCQHCQAQDAARRERLKRVPDVRAAAAGDTPKTTREEF